MTLNESLTKQNVITKLDITELSKELRVKVMRIRMAYNKIKKQFEEDVKEFVEQAASEELKTLANKTDRSVEEETKFKELNSKFNSEYSEFIIQKGFETVNDIEDNFTNEEFEDIVGNFTDSEVEINNNKISAADFLEAFAELFVK